IAARDGTPQDVFEQHLYLIRRTARSMWRARTSVDARPFHFTSLSSRTIIYKGLLLPQQIETFYQDLSDPLVETAFAIVHQRYSTNTFPTWALAQPFRYLAHNGEINTIRGNASWMRARERTLRSDAFGDRIHNLCPILTSGASDSAQLDNAVELLVMSGRSVAHALTLLVPEAWEDNPTLPDQLRAYYEYHSLLTESWDGPAALTFTDGVRVGAMLDRNGLRPARFTLTNSGVLVIASETGVLNTPADQVKESGRLSPGKMVIADTELGRLLHDDEIKEQLGARRPWRAWVDQNRLLLDALPPAASSRHIDPDAIPQLHKAFGYTLEDLRLVFPPMINTGQEAIGSMGDDTALACLSDRPRLIYHYFRQLFSQVTNPPIDSLRERMVMSNASTLGRDGNLLEETPDAVRLIRLELPVLTDEQLERVRQVSMRDIRTVTLSTVFSAHEGEAGMRATIERVCREASAAVEEGITVIILSDRGVSPQHMHVPALLVTSEVHQHLVRTGQRTLCGLAVETGEAWEVAHFALLIGYGAGAINPYLAFGTIAQLVQDHAHVDEGITIDKAVANYIKAIDKGLLKIYAKMGISTLQAYRGAQVFEAVGLHRDFLAKYFEGTRSRVSGVGLDVIARESGWRHELAFARDARCRDELDPGGLYQWRRRGEKHTFHPDAIAKLQHAVRTQSFETFKEFSRSSHEESDRLCTLRSLLDFRFTERAVPLAQIEPAGDIVRRFCTGAMSFGAISKEAHEALAIAMNRIGGRSNTGEGGEDPGRFVPELDGESKRSAIKQVASGRFGVTSYYLVNADELQIKIAQGAKPGEGGQLPGHKVDEIVARIRNSTQGVGLISPPPHHDIYSIEDIAQLIHDLKCANPQARVTVKLVSETGVGTVAAGVVKGKADGVLISGHDGGTGASPLTSIKWAGTPWEIGLSETQQTLVLNDLRGRVSLQVDGGLKTGRDVVIGALLGADEFGFATAPLVAMGCVMMRACHTNTCPVGIATQDPELRRRFRGLPEHVVQYFFFVAEEVRELMSRLGFRRFEQMVGRVDRLFPKHTDHWKACHLDFTNLLHKPDVPYVIRHCERQQPALDDALDRLLVVRALPALERKEPVTIDVSVTNVNRTIGTILGSEVSRRFGTQGLPDDTITIRLTGTAGQSLGAFLPSGITLLMEGDANDYVGKGLSGGKIVIRTPRKATFDPADNVLVGNVCLYGATSGAVFINGVAGERFCVRNSGATAVVEGVGDHGCEYMTGGRVVILGQTGRNFAAGMSGGIAYVLDEREKLRDRCNLGMVELEPLPEEDAPSVKQIIEQHLEATSSDTAFRVLVSWQVLRHKFVRVMPLDYKRALAERIAARSGNG
ncbi:MAG: glutamate synthase large subunit, partial [Polyangiaceae bacterium]|nr:glutamate synthase large subunit [Polyangiaceae bacterium]